MKSWGKRILLGLLFVAVMIQALRPVRTNPTTAPRDDLAMTTTVHPPVAATMQRACRDCHSNATAWPWYSHVAPVSWMVANDVNRGRREMNLSLWRQYSPGRQQKLLAKMCEEVRSGEMPDTAYTLMHPQAKLTAGDVDAFCNWTRTQTMAPATETGEQVED